MTAAVASRFSSVSGRHTFQPKDITVITRTRQRGADQDEHHHEEGRFQREPDEWRQERTLPAAEEQRHNQGGHGDDTDVFPTKNRPNFMPEYSMW